MPSSLLLLAGLASPSHAAPVALEWTWTHDDPGWTDGLGQAPAFSPGELLEVEIHDPDPFAIYSVSVGGDAPPVVGFAPLGGDPLVPEDPANAPNQEAKLKLLEAVRLVDLSVRRQIQWRLPDAGDTLRDLQTGLGTALSTFRTQSSDTSDTSLAARRALELDRVIDAVLDWMDQSKGPGLRALSIGRVPAGRPTTVQVCRQTLDLSSYLAETTLLQATAPDCSAPRELRSTRGKGTGSGVVSALSVVAPAAFYTPRDFRLVENPQGDGLQLEPVAQALIRPQPLLSVGVEHRFGGGADWSLGGDVGAAVGDRIGRMYTLGAFLGVDAFSLGVGLWGDVAGSRARVRGVTTGTVEQRTRTVPWGGAYVRLGISGERLVCALSGKRGCGRSSRGDRPAPSKAPAGPPAASGPAGQVVLRVPPALRANGRQVNGCNHGIVDPQGFPKPGGTSSYAAWTLRHPMATAANAIGHFLAFPTSYADPLPATFQAGRDHVRWKTGSGAPGAWPAEFRMRCESGGLASPPAPPNVTQWTASAEAAFVGPPRSLHTGAGVDHLYSIHAGPSTSTDRVGWLTVDTDSGDLLWFADASILDAATGLIDEATELHLFEHTGSAPSDPATYLEAASAGVPYP